VKNLNTIFLGTPFISITFSFNFFSPYLSDLRDKNWGGLAKSSQSRKALRLFFLFPDQNYIVEDYDIIKLASSFLFIIYFELNCPFYFRLERWAP
jgi:hypothetical protein